MESQSGNVFFNPYSSRSRPSSRSRREPPVTPERVRDPLEGDRQDTVRLSIATARKETSGERSVPGIISDEKQRRSGFFSNLKNLVESKKLKPNMLRGLNTTANMSQSRPGKI